ncbi:hypothetical protein SAMN05421821_11123 [Mucilaginibacter lappiensis]|uniref:Uncharacterized protein n=1 Tax=Mucilaginibacter lappiensis TaxID=354630 RepID=A0ABR6PN65_9SPHI|nr:hypothetical protein [Mucilaginibacter lappiensis]SIR73100.1 hypothetical protein SAMN05421821_11123 [Mucilaginibacter lappiensis]
MLLLSTNNYILLIYLTLLPNEKKSFNNYLSVCAI